MGHSWRIVSWNLKSYNHYEKLSYVVLLIILRTARNIHYSISVLSDIIHQTMPSNISVSLWVFFVFQSNNILGIKFPILCQRTSVLACRCQNSIFLNVLFYKLNFFLETQRGSAKRREETQPSDVKVIVSKRDWHVYFEKLDSSLFTQDTLTDCTFTKFFH